MAEIVTASILANSEVITATLTSGSEQMTAIINVAARGPMGPVGSAELDELSDVSITSAVAGQALMRGASLWTNRSLVIADISDATTSVPFLAAASNTFTGLASFTSTTRPTSSGTGTPAATSLMTRDDVALAELQYRHAAKSRFISTLLPTTISGSVGNTAFLNGASLTITAANTFSGVSFGNTQIHDIYSGTQMSFARKFIASTYFVLRAITDLNAVVRFFVGAANSYRQGVDALSTAGICVEIARSGTDIQARLVYFSGTFKTTSWVTIFNTTSIFARTNTLVIRNNGSGQVDVFITSNPATNTTITPIPDLFGTPTISVSDGPTTAPSASVLLQASYGATVADTPIASSTLLVQNFTLEFTA